MIKILATVWVLQCESPLSKWYNAGKKDSSRRYRHFFDSGSRQHAPVRLTSLQGEIVWSEKTGVWGEKGEVYAERISNPLRFQGQYFDAERLNTLLTSLAASPSYYCTSLYPHCSAMYRHPRHREGKAQCRCCRKS